MFAPSDSWVWDFWLADDGRDHHMFFLVAPKSLRAPHARHRHARIGHAVSSDLRHWSRLDDAIVPGGDGQFDSLATWTGCTVRHPDGTWFLFYTGVAESGHGIAQSIGYATSPDLLTWTKSPGNPVLIPDGRTYESLDASGHGGAFRDPWVFRDPADDGWHMLMTAADGRAAAGMRGVVGHAWSADLEVWQARPPLSRPGEGFPVLEVLQVEVVDGRPVLLFSCPPDETSAPVAADNTRGGVWAATAVSPLGPYAICDARQIVESGLYSGRIVRSRDSGRWVFLAFDADPDSPTFLQISDPRPLEWRDGAFLVASQVSQPPPPA